jgi:subtilisin family serine protease
MSGDPRIAFVEAMQQAKLASAVPFDNYVWSIITPSELMEQYAFGMLDMGSMGSGGEGGGGGKGGKMGFGAGLNAFSTPLRGSVAGNSAEQQIMHAREAIGEAPVMSTNRLLELYGSGSGAHGITRGAGITVAVIDTGFDRDHPALDGAWTQINTHLDLVDNDSIPEEEQNGIDDDGDGEIDEAYGHGTFVAGIVHLMAPDAKIMPIRVLNDDGQAHEYEVAMAINHAMARGADVINLSLVIPNHSSLLQDTMANAAQAGISVIAAAGNEGVQTIHYPAGDNCAVAVTAIDEDRYKSSFANYGSWVDLTTPGEAVYSAFPVTPIPGSPGQSYYYAAWSGSSVATPFAAGQAALLRSLNPQLGAGAISRYLASSALSVDAQNPAYAGLLGRGLPQVMSSLNTLLYGSLPGSQHNLLSACPTAY